MRDIPDLLQLLHSNQKGLQARQEQLSARLDKLEGCADMLEAAHGEIRKLHAEIAIHKSNLKKARRLIMNMAAKLAE